MNGLSRHSPIAVLCLHYISPVSILVLFFFFFLNVSAPSRELNKERKLGIKFSSYFFTVPGQRGRPKWAWRLVKRSGFTHLIQVGTKGEGKKQKTTEILLTEKIPRLRTHNIYYRLFRRCCCCCSREFLFLFFFRLAHNHKSRTTSAHVE